VAFVEEAITYAKNKMCNKDGCDVVADAIALAMDRLAVSNATHSRHALQHTWNILQHTAAHCNTLQHAATWMNGM